MSYLSDLRPGMLEEARRHEALRLALEAMSMGVEGAIRQNAKKFERYLKDGTISNEVPA